MSIFSMQSAVCMVVEEEIEMSLFELCHATNANTTLVTAWVLEGILTPEGSSPAEWIFSGDSLKRAKTAMRLTLYLEINTAGVAMVIELLDEISRLNKKLT